MVLQHALERSPAIDAAARCTGWVMTRTGVRAPAMPVDGRSGSVGNPSHSWTNARSRSSSRHSGPRGSRRPCGPAAGAGLPTLPQPFGRLAPRPGLSRSAVRTKEICVGRRFSAPPREYGVLRMRPAPRRRMIGACRRAAAPPAPGRRRVHPPTPRTGAEKGRPRCSGPWERGQRRQGREDCPRCPNSPPACPDASC
jgi:hypothetical protein